MIIPESIQWNTNGLPLWPFIWRTTIVDFGRWGLSHAAWLMLTQIEVISTRRNSFRKESREESELYSVISNWSNKYSLYTIVYIYTSRGGFWLFFGGCAPLQLVLRTPPTWICTPPTCELHPPKKFVVYCSIIKSCNLHSADRKKTFLNIIIWLSIIWPILLLPDFRSKKGCVEQFFHKSSITGLLCIICISVQFKNAHLYKLYTIGL